MIDALPTCNAVLNSLCALCLCAGYMAIRRQRRELHARLMVAALVASGLFLVSYLVHKFARGPTAYGDRPYRTLYLVVLGTHTVLAALNVPLVVLTVVRAAKRQFDRHRRIARWTLPVWLYVSVTGVLVYLMLYRW